MPTLRSALVLLTLASLATSAHAADSDAVADRFRISAGGFFVNFDTRARLDSDELGIGEEIRLETDLNLQHNQPRFRLDGYWRFFERHRIDFTYFDLDRNASNRITGEIEFGDQIFRVDETVLSRWRNRIIQARYNYSLIQREHFEWLIGAGISAIKLNLDLEVEGRDARAEGDEIGVPIPVISTRATWRVRPEAHLNFDLAWIKGNIGDIEGRFLDFAVTFDYFVTRNFGFGFGYNIVDAEYLEEKRLRRFDTDMRFDGLRLYGTVAF